MKGGSRPKEFPEQRGNACYAARSDRPTTMRAPRRARTGSLSRRLGYQGPSRGTAEACQLPDRQLQGRQKPQVTQPVKDEQHDPEVEPHVGDGAERRGQDEQEESRRL
jgi:hypothetical protein